MSASTKSATSSPSLMSKLTSGFKNLGAQPTPQASDTLDGAAELAPPYAEFTGVRICIIGAGQRGRKYASYALQHPDLCKVVAIAEPREKTRAMMVKAHVVSPVMTFNTWEDFIRASDEHQAKNGAGERLADAVVVAVQDKAHMEVVLPFASRGYHVLCEKPMATSPEECIRMADAVKQAGVIFGCGHVLRYSPYNQAVTEIIRSKRLGDIVNIVHVEPVGYFHFAHSYVRGNWSSEKESSFSLMTKSCHDIDILCHYLAPATPLRVSSFGSLAHFRKSAKPAAAGSATRCLDCPMTDCPYDARKIYLEPVKSGMTGWPVSTIIDGQVNVENVTEALENGPYGKCVYESHNDVVDNQVVNLEYSNGATVSFTMVAFTDLICERQTRIHFTHGELVGDMSTFRTVDFRTTQGQKHHPAMEDRTGHGGGDIGLIRSFVRAVKEGKQDILGTDVEEVLKSHLTVFAAEQSRKEGRVVSCEEYEKQVRASMM